ncbi:brachyurin-like [Zophobas morio]|uniref:brachyurin-like n=1 Tax=Zophobas morio TaxID=2755281 RepID=UPI003082E19A
MSKFSILCLIIALFYSKAVTSEKRIVGGQAARAGQFPFAAGIHVTTDDGRFFCGGVLYNNQWIITAGQCVYNAVLFSIQLGSNYLTADDPNRLVLATSSYLLHTDFNPETLENDVGLIRFRIPIEFTDYIQPIFYLPANDMKPDYGLLATGWGQISDDDAELTDELKWVTITSLTNDECKITYGDQIKDYMLCAAGNYNEGLCIGDIGSPLVELIKYGNGCLAGIASFFSGNGCESTDPSGFTRIYPYVAWIRNVTSE